MELLALSLHLRDKQKKSGSMGAANSKTVNQGPFIIHTMYSDDGLSCTEYSFRDMGRSFVIEFTFKLNAVTFKARETKRHKFMPILSRSWSNDADRYERHRQLPATEVVVPVEVITAVRTFIAGLVAIDIGIQDNFLKY